MKKSKPGKRSKRFLRDSKFFQGQVAWSNHELGVYLMVKPHMWREYRSGTWWIHPIPMVPFNSCICHEEIDRQADLVVKDIEKWRKSAHQHMDKIIPFMMTKKMRQHVSSKSLNFFGSSPNQTPL